MLARALRICECCFGGSGWTALCRRDVEAAQVQLHARVCPSLMVSDLTGRYSRHVNDPDVPDLPDGIDAELWFEMDGCPGRHYLLDDSPGILGRMSAYCPTRQDTTRVSKVELTVFSGATAYFVRGFLAGSQLPPPVDKEGLLVQDQAVVEEWRTAAKVYRETGAWPRHR
jgi:hypothetical protein